MEIEITRNIAVLLFAFGPLLAIGLLKAAGYFASD